MGQSIDSTMPGSELIELFVGPVGSYPMIWQNVRIIDIGTWAKGKSWN